LLWADEQPRIKNGIVNFDTRLIKILTYLSSRSNATCGGSKKHELIGLSTKIDDSLSDLSYPDENLPSSSTIDRGVGVRVSELDRVKCTLICPSKPPVTFGGQGYEIALSYSDLIYPSAVVPSDCNVRCAVDYYPASPVDALPENVIKPNYPAALTSYDPGEFSYDQITDFSRKAAIFKGAQLGYEILKVDDAGCYASSQNTGNKKIIPTTVLFPLWLQKALGDDWQKVFLSLAQKNFPYNFQQGSPTAGLWYDPYLNNIGLHLNY